MWWYLFALSCFLFVPLFTPVFYNEALLMSLGWDVVGIFLLGLPS